MGMIEKCAEILSDQNRTAFIILLGILLAMIVILVIARVYVSGFQADSSKNGGIEAMRLVISICVVVHHYCGYSPGGYLGVDFFFVLSGFFLMKHFERYEGSNNCAAEAAMQYTFERYKRIIPHYIFTCILALILTLYMDGHLSVLDWIQNGMWELLMLEAFGMTENLMIGPGWYCSALLIAGFVIYYFLSKFKKTYLYFVAPFSFMGIFAWMMNQFGHLNRWLQYDTVISTGVLRGFAEIGLGCICYKIAGVILCKKKVSIWQSTLLEVICVIIILYTIRFQGLSRSDFSCVLFMAILITSLFIKNSLWSRFFNHWLFKYMGKISMAVFLNHMILGKIDWSQLFHVSWNTSFLFYVFFVILFSCLSTELVELAERKYWEEKR